MFEGLTPIQKFLLVFAVLFLVVLALTTKKPKD